MGALKSAFPLRVLNTMLKGDDGQIGLGSAEWTQISGAGYTAQDAKDGNWTIGTIDGKGTATNAGKIYFPEATAAYSDDVTHVLFLYPGFGIIYSLELDDALTVAQYDRVKINKYVSGEDRGIKLELWEV